MTAEDIIKMKPGPELDNIVCESEEEFSPSTNMNDAWDLRLQFLEDCGGSFENRRYCDQYPEHCCYEIDGKKVLVWAETASEAITKTIALAAKGLYGDFHPWKLFPELQTSFMNDLKANTKLFNK